MMTSSFPRVLHASFVVLRRDKNVLNKYFMSVFVRLFLEKRERALMKFISDFQKLTVSDEKVSLATFLRGSGEERGTGFVISSKRILFSISPQMRGTRFHDARSTTVAFLDPV